MNSADVSEGRHGAAQAVGFARREAGPDNRNLHGLFLEKGNTKRFREHGLQCLRGIFNGLGAGTPTQIGMHHVALNRPRADDRDLDHKVIEAAGLEARQHRHLRAAFDLEHADRIRPAQHLVDIRIFRRHGRQDARARGCYCLLDRAIARCFC